MSAEDVRGRKNVHMQELQDTQEPGMDDLYANSCVAPPGKLGADCTLAAQYIYIKSGVSEEFCTYYAWMDSTADRQSCSC